MAHAEIRGRRRRLWIGGGLAALLLLALVAYLYPGARLAWEILHTPTHSLVVSKWETLRLKSLRRSLVDNLPQVRESSFVSRGGTTLSYLDMEPGDYPIEMEIRSEQGDFVVAYRCDLSREVQPRTRRGIVFILHGYGLFKEAMLPWGGALARQGYRVVLVDLPAHGASSPGPLGFGRRDAEMLKVFIDEYRSEADTEDDFAAVLGCSYGATIAMHLGVLDCHIDGIVAIAPFGDLRTAIRGFARGLSVRIPNHAMEVAAFLVEAWAGKNAVEFNVRESDPPAVLFFHPENDLVTPASEFNRLVENSFPNACIEVLRGIEHMEAGLPFAESVGRVIHFLDEASARTGATEMTQDGQRECSAGRAGMRFVSCD